MKKGVKLALFSILVVFLLSVSIHLTVAAEGDTTPTSLFTQKVTEIVSNIVGGETNYDYLSNILSPIILFGILIFLVIFAVVSQISIFSNSKPIKLGVSAVVALLASLFINQAWINPLLNGYESIGILILFALPFVLLFYFVKEVIPTQRLLQHIVWGVFAIIVLVNLIINMGSDDVGWFTIEFWIYVIVFVMSLMMLIAGHKIIAMMFKDEVRGEVSKRTREAMAALEADIDADTARLSSLTGAARTSMEARLRRKKETLAKMSAE